MASAWQVARYISQGSRRDHTGFRRSANGSIVIDDDRMIGWPRTYWSFSQVTGNLSYVLSDFALKRNPNLSGHKKRGQTRYYQSAAICGTLTEGETVTVALGGNPPPFAVIFSDRSSGGQATTVTTVTASDLPSTAGLLAGPESEDFFSLIIPTLTATSVQVAISYIGAGGSGLFELQSVALSPATSTSYPINIRSCHDNKPYTQRFNLNPCCTYCGKCTEKLGRYNWRTIAGALFLFFTLLLWIRRRRRLARSAVPPADLHSADEESISPFVAGIIETQAGANVTQKTRGVGVAGSTSSGATSTQGARLKQTEVQAQDHNAQEELRTTREALDLLRDERDGSREEIVNLQQRVAELMRRLEEVEDSPPDYYVSQS
ncbi:hypothetical protein BDP27DRAFT_1488551 [Rhodocollybia butyracea]|uniref:Uncharacterized protein n=1 Tax=Rhodocollybia butyracea TaxID=206335 RepID=A0A9P5U1A0_9AGAR|nr:hypothetical protein BDP27DRAFT_1488551 [Rhodocollybia butyracea]